MFILGSRSKEMLPQISKILLLILLAFLMLTPLFSTTRYEFTRAASASSGPVIVVQLDVPIDQGSSGLVARAASSALASHASAVIINMNTPGGLLQDMVSIVDSISNLTSEGIPVYTYVANDSLAASAGSYIAMSTGKIFMGPGSQIGPSTPIVEGGSALQQNHTAGAMLTLMTSLAEEHGRNITAATQMVAYDIAYSYSDALRYHIADESSNSLGQTIQLLNLSNSKIITISESPTEQLLSFLSNPTIAGIILLLGIIAIALDFLHPTVILSIAGVILIALGIIGSEAIQSGAYSGAVAVPLIFFAVAATLIVFEIKTGHGIMLFAGVAVGAFATLLLAYEVPYSPSPFGDLQYIELGVLIVAGGLLGVYARWVGGSLRKKPVTGIESIAGKQGVVTSELDPVGEVKVEGVIWKARLIGDHPNKVAKGERVIVLKVRGLTLDVEPEHIKEKVRV